MQASKRDFSLCLQSDKGMEGFSIYLLTGLDPAPIVDSALQYGEVSHVCVSKTYKQG